MKEKEDIPKAKFIFRTNEEVDKSLSDALVKLIAKQLYEANFKPRTFESC